MSISSVGGASALSQLYSVQQAPADTPVDSMSNASAGQTGDNNALTGTSMSNLSSQTLQALLDLTQQDPGTDPSQASQTGQAQETHRRHGHHGGMMQAQPGDPAQPSATTAASTDPLQTAADDTSADTEASLTSALMNA
jgi:hypothetical protein